MDWLSPEEISAIRLSLLVATVATLASLPFGLAVAFVLARKQFSSQNGVLTTPPP